MVVLQTSLQALQNTELKHNNAISLNSCFHGATGTPQHVYMHKSHASSGNGAGPGSHRRSQGRSRRLRLLTPMAPRSAKSTSLMARIDPLFPFFFGPVMRICLSLAPSSRFPTSLPPANGEKRAVDFPMLGPKPYTSWNA